MGAGWGRGQETGAEVTDCMSRQAKIGGDRRSGK